MERVTEKHKTQLATEKAKVSELRSDLDQVTRSRSQEVTRLEELVHNLEGQVSSLQSENEKTLR